MIDRKDCQQLQAQPSSQAQENANSHRGYIADKTRRLLQIDSGEIGILVKMALLSGLRKEELAYIYYIETCSKSNLDKICPCKKLHVFNRPTGTTIIVANWHWNRKHCYLTIVPTCVWERFKSLRSFVTRDIVIADWLADKLAGMDFAALRSLYLKLLRQALSPDDIAILSGKAKPNDAQHFLAAGMDRLGKLEQGYCRAWYMAGIQSWRQVCL